MIVYMRRIDTSTGQEVFWTGESTEKGTPCESVDIRKGKPFEGKDLLTANRMGRAAANLQGNMDWWNPKRVT